MTEHAFAEYVRTLGRGKRARRSLTREEARNAMQMILDGKVEDVQLGAFLMQKMQRAINSITTTGLLGPQGGMALQNLLAGCIVLSLGISIV